MCITMNNCKLLAGVQTYFIQFLLGFLSLSSLYVKRKLEYPQRQWTVFKYDVSKQIVGMGFAHLINISIAVMIRKQYDMPDECRWYFLNFLIDVTIGILINYYLLETFKRLYKKYSWTSLTPGEYQPSNNCYNKSFVLQLCNWLLIILISKALVLYLIIIPMRHTLDSFGKWFLGPVSHNNSLELFIVMILLPLLFNLTQFWVQDNILKGRKHYIDTCLIQDGQLEVTGNTVDDNGYSVEYTEL